MGRGWRPRAKCRHARWDSTWVLQVRKGTWARPPRAWLPCSAGPCGQAPDTQRRRHPPGGLVNGWKLGGPGMLAWAQHTLWQGWLAVSGLPGSRWPLPGFCGVHKTSQDQHSHPDSSLGCPHLGVWCSAVAALKSMTVSLNLSFKPGTSGARARGFELQLLLSCLLSPPTSLGQVLALWHPGLLTCPPALARVWAQAQRGLGLKQMCPAAFRGW